jgi:long-subunit fatty acid transport protein
MKSFKLPAAIKKEYFALICALSYFVFSTAPAQAAGLWVFEQGTPDLGTAAAGRAAMAKDASTAFGNPAGMTRLKDSQITAGAQALFPRIKFDADNSSFGGGNGGNAGVLISPREGTRFGVQYRSKIELEYEDEPDLSDIGPLLQAALNLTGLAGSSVKLDMEIPQAVLASAYHEVTDKLAIMGNIGWQN